MDLSNNPPQFAIGIVSTASTRSRQRRATQTSAPKSPIFKTNESLFSERCLWYILPDTKFPAKVSIAIQTASACGGFASAYKAWQEIPGKFNSPFGQTNFTFETETSFFPEESAEFKDTILTAIYLNQTVRWRLKRLIHPWRLARFKQINDTDAVTMDVPKNPVWIYDWANRSKYVFESKSVFKDIRTRLGLTEQFFPISKYPRNPFTNERLTIGQLHFLLNDLRSKGFAHWTTETLRACKYNMTTFQKRNATQLKMDALDKVFADPTGDECIDVVYDFITAEYEYHYAEMRRQDVWIWFLRTKPTHSHIRDWISLCRFNYHAMITKPREFEENIEDHIHAESGKLIIRSNINYMIAHWNIGRRLPPSSGQDL